jgi:hypothetical protein
MICLSVLAVLPAALILAFAVGQRQTNLSIPPTPKSILWLLAMFIMLGILVVSTVPWEWDSIFDLLASLVPFGVGGALVYLYAERLVWSIRLDRSITTYKVKGGTAASRQTAEASDFIDYRYGSNLRGKARSSNRYRYGKQVVVLPDRPEIHRLLPGEVPKHVKSQRRRLVLFALGLLIWASVLVVIVLLLNLKPLSATLIIMAGIFIWIFATLSILNPSAAGQQELTPVLTISANKGELAKEIRKIIDSEAHQFVIFTDQSSGRFVQFLGPGADNPDLIIDVPLVKTSAELAQKLRDCFSSLDVEPVVSNSADSLMGSFDADAGLAADMALTLLVDGLEVKAGSKLNVIFGETM